MPELFCLSCGYNLEGTTGGKCPECGRAFDAGLLADHIRSRLITFGDVLKRLVISSILPTILFFIVGCAGMLTGMVFDFGDLPSIVTIVILTTIGVVVIWRCAPTAMAISQGIAMHLAFHARASGSISNSRIFVYACAVLILAAQFAIIFAVIVGVFRGVLVLIGGVIAM